MPVPRTGYAVPRVGAYTDSKSLGAGEGGAKASPRAARKDSADAAVHARARRAARGLRAGRLRRRRLGAALARLAAFIDLVPALPASLDPADEQGAGFDAVETSLAGTLVRPAGGSLGAATLPPPTRWSASSRPPGTSSPIGDYVFVLRRGVRSAYGHTLSGADVSFSFARELARSAFARFLARAGANLAARPGHRARRRARAAERERRPARSPSRCSETSASACSTAAPWRRTRAPRTLPRRAGSRTTWPSTAPYELTSFEPAARPLRACEPGLLAAARVRRSGDRGGALVEPAPRRTSPPPRPPTPPARAGRLRGRRAHRRPAGGDAAVGRGQCADPGERFRPLPPSRSAAPCRWRSTARRSRGTPSPASPRRRCRRPRHPPRRAERSSRPLATRMTSRWRGRCSRRRLPARLLVVLAACVADSPQAPAELAAIARQLGRSACGVTVRYAASAARSGGADARRRRRGALETHGDANRLGRVHDPRAGRCRLAGRSRRL